MGGFVKDTVVGIIGALVIVGSLGGAIAFLDEDTIVEDAPAAFDQTRWSGDACRSLTLVWEVEVSALEGFVEPWSVREDGSGMGEFRLIAWECGENTVNNAQEGSEAGSLAVIGVEEPEDSRNMTADTWWASPEVVREPGEAVGEAFMEHGFPVSSGSVSFEVTDALAAFQVEAVVESRGGTVEVSGAFVGSGEDAEARSATLAPGEDAFSVLVGSRNGQQREAVDVSVESTGDTWVERFGLGEPDEAWFVSGETWGFSLWDLPFDAARPAGS